MRKEIRGELRLIMNGKCVRYRMYTQKRKRRQIINEWTNEIRRLKNNTNEFFISITLIN